jgi:hypothetical protein
MMLNELSSIPSFIFLCKYSGVAEIQTCVSFVRIWKLVAVIDIILKILEILNAFLYFCSHLKILKL